MRVSRRASLNGRKQFWIRKVYKNTSLSLSPVFIPEQFQGVPYRGEFYPGAPNLGPLKQGANCQVFAYEFLRYHGFFIPDFRSSNLWEDKTYTQQIRKPEPLDLILVHDNQDSWGAHVGVYVGQDKVLHLSKSIGFPAVEPLEDLTKKPKYRFLIGFKRCIAHADVKKLSHKSASADAHH